MFDSVGPLLSFPVSQLNIVISSLSVGPGTPLAWISNTLSLCVSKVTILIDYLWCSDVYSWCYI